MTQLDKAKELGCTFAYLPLEETKFSPVVVMHPFFENAFLADKDGIFNALVEEERYNKYVEDFCKRLNKCKNIEEILMFVRKSYRLTYLKFLRSENIVTTKECGNLLAKVWDTIEVINHDINVPQSQVLKWIKNADKNVLMNEKELEIYQNIEDEITVYRGCENEKELKGISWTIDENVAKWFAKRFNKNGECFKAKINKKYVIGYLECEKEIILDFHYITDVEQVC